MLNMLILEILREYTDENHSLTQQEIIKLLKQNYDMSKFYSRRNFVKK